MRLREWALCSARDKKNALYLPTEMGAIKTHIQYVWSIRLQKWLEMIPKAKNI